MKYFLPFLLFLLFSSVLLATQKPNIILIMSDDMGYSDLGCYGGEIATPHLDTLAAGGVRFTQFYNTARCCPTRASLLTGLHPHEAGMGHMTGARHHLPGYQGDLLPTSVTIAEVLKNAGYRNYCIGKWHVTDQTRAEGPKENWPLQRGFDRYYGIIHGAANYFDPASLVRDNTAISPFNDPEYKPEQEYYLTTALSSQAARFIAEHKQQTPEQPFFMYVAYTAAHWPMHAPDEMVAKYHGKYNAGYAAIRKERYEKMKALNVIDPQWNLTPQAEKWDTVTNKPWEARRMEVYAAMISEMDNGIGQIVDTLKKTEQYENTVIFYLQDNGACAENIGRSAEGKYRTRPNQPVLPPIPLESVIDKRTVVESQTRDGYPVIRGKGVLPGPKDTFIAYGRGWANVSNTPFREYKHWVHEGGISTPLIIHAPKQIDDSIKGSFYREPGQLIDVMSTCVDLADAAYPKQYHGNNITAATGTSLVPAFTGQSLERVLPLVWEHEGNRAIRENKWKLVAKGPVGAWELYDVEKDRSELNNLAEKYPEKVADLSKKWNDWAVKANVLPWPWKKEQQEIILDTTPGKKLEFDFTQEKEDSLSWNDLSGKKNSFTVVGKLPVLSRNGETAQYFNGRSYIDIKKSSALAAARAPWKIQVLVEPESPNGVILAYGGSMHGYSLFLKDGKVGFALRLDGEVFIVSGDRPIQGKAQWDAVITADKKIELYTDGNKIASIQVPNLLLQEPAEALQIGTDNNGNVSGLDLPNFKGWLSKIILSREKE